MSSPMSPPRGGGANLPADVPPELAAFRSLTDLHTVRQQGEIFFARLQQAKAQITDQHRLTADLHSAQARASAAERTASALQASAAASSGLTPAARLQLENEKLALSERCRELENLNRSLERRIASHARITKLDEAVVDVTRAQQLKAEHAQLEQEARNDLQRTALASLTAELEALTAHISHARISNSTPGATSTTSFRDRQAPGPATLAGTPPPQQLPLLLGARAAIKSSTSSSGDTTSYAALVPTEPETFARLEQHREDVRVAGGRHQWKTCPSHLRPLVLALAVYVEKREASVAQVHAELAAERTRGALARLRTPSPRLAASPGGGTNVLGLPGPSGTPGTIRDQGPYSTTGTPRSASVQNLMGQAGAASIRSSPHPSPGGPTTGGRVHRAGQWNEIRFVDREAEEKQREAAQAQAQAQTHAAVVRSSLSMEESFVAESAVSAGMTDLGMSDGEMSVPGSPFRGSSVYGTPTRIQRPGRGPAVRRALNMESAG